MREGADRIRESWKRNPEPQLNGVYALFVFAEYAGTRAGNRGRRRVALRGKKLQTKTGADNFRQEGKLYAYVGVMLLDLTSLDTAACS